VSNADKPDLSLFLDILDILHTDGRSSKHESDIYDMLVFRYLQADPALSATFDETYLDAQAQALGPDVAELWESIKLAACAEARREDGAATESL